MNNIEYVNHKEYVDAQKHFSPRSLNAPNLIFDYKTEKLKRSRSNLNGEVAHYQHLALAFVDMLIEAKPTDPLARINRGTLLLHMGQTQAAIEDYTYALTLNADLAVALSNRGTAFATIDQLDRAVSDFDAALERDPSLDVALIGRGATYLKLGRLSDASIDFSNCLELNPEQVCVYLLLADVYFGLGKYEEADQAIDEALLRENDSVEALQWKRLSIRDESRPR